MSQPEQPEQGRVYAIANQKGGVGKTTTAVNLAASLAACERATLLIDLDPQANATSAFGISGVERHVYDALTGECVMKDLAVATDLEYLHIVPAGRDLVGAEIELVSGEARERRLAGALADVRALYEFVLVDCPPSLGLLTLNALTAADGVIVPLQCEYYALEGLAALLETIDLVRERLNSQAELTGIVLTMMDPRNSLTNQVAAEVRRHFGERVFRTGVPRNVRLAEAPSHGKPVLLYDIHSKGAVAYLRLARELLERLRVNQPSRRPPPLATPPVPAEEGPHGAS